MSIAPHATLWSTECSLVHAQISPNSNSNNTLPITTVGTHGLQTRRAIADLSAAPARLDRLIHIGTSSQPLGIDALHLALEEAKKGKDVDKYLAITRYLGSIAPKDPQAVPDLEWAELKQQRLHAETTRLEQELKGYRNNLIKESIRVSPHRPPDEAAVLLLTVGQMGNEDLGNHYFSIGDLTSASKAYNRMRDQCTTPKHICDMSLRIILTAISSDNWIGVQQTLRKIADLQLKPEEKAKIQPLISPLQGLAHLATGQYLDAAESFLNTAPEYQTMDPVAGNPAINFQRQVISANDVAIYGALTVLASRDRDYLRRHVLENPRFRQYLELEPHLRRAIAAFIGSKFRTCLEILESHRADYYLDMHLGRHVDTLYAAIRRRSIIQYVKPFSKVRVSSLCQAFSLSSEADTMDEVVGLIEDNHLGNMRLDAVDGVLEAVQKDDRRAAHEHALRVAAETEQSLRLRLYRINCLQHGLEIKKPEGAQGSRGGNARQGKIGA